MVHISQKGAPETQGLQILSKIFLSQCTVQNCKNKYKIADNLLTMDNKNKSIKENNFPNI